MTQLSTIIYTLISILTVGVIRQSLLVVEEGIEPSRVSNALLRPSHSALFTEPATDDADATTSQDGIRASNPFNNGSINTPYSHANGISGNSSIIGTDSSNDKNKWLADKGNKLQTSSGILSKVYDDERSEALVVYSIFAGRRDPLAIQLPYILKLLEKGVVDEVHVWNYTCRGPYRNPPDNQYLNEVFLPANQSGIFLMRDPPQCEWTTFYDFYALFLTRHDRDVLLKVDDDIVYVDTSRVSAFVHEIRSFPQVFLWSANVINNGKAAAFQTMDGLLSGNAAVSMKDELGPRGKSLGKVYNNGSLGLAIHQEFLADPKKFFQPVNPIVRRVKGRLSINFIGMIGRQLQRAALLASKHHPDDEKALTTVASFQNETVLIYTPLLAAHASFRVQYILQKACDLYRHYNTSDVLAPSNSASTPPSRVRHIPGPDEVNSIGFIE